MQRPGDVRSGPKEMWKQPSGTQAVRKVGMERVGQRQSHRGSRAGSRTPAPLPHLKPEQFCFDLYYVFLLGCKISLGPRNLCLKKILEIVTVGAGEPWKGLEQNKPRGRLGD